MILMRQLLCQAVLKYLLWLQDAVYLFPHLSAFPFLYMYWFVEYMIPVDSNRNTIRNRIQHFLEKNLEILDRAVTQEFCYEK
ncbi:MAG: hypothetical protein ACD_48C00059G0003 [uncultured bacterium]|nr:MAG: hypothetical protein ACD_48C00059G0003 [uncultured bacterium]